MTAFETDVLHCVQNQLDFNKGRNLFFLDIDTNHLSLSTETLDFIETHRAEILLYFNSHKDKELEVPLIEQITEEALQQLYLSNQYLQFTLTDKEKLGQFYVDLFAELLSFLENKNTSTMHEIMLMHYKKIRQWMDDSNPFIKIMNQNQPFLVPIACSDYTAPLQLQVMQLELANLKEPILDVGCGIHSNMVNFLRNRGLEAYGIDRTINSNDRYVQQFDWNDYTFAPQSWGTVLAHLSFSNHFVHHHYRNDGHYAEYAVKYMEILDSLVPGGSFYYAPGLPFIEKYLDPEKFQVKTEPIKGVKGALPIKQVSKVIKIIKKSLYGYYVQ
jgi:hypothetical protein